MNDSRFVTTLLSMAMLLFGSTASAQNTYSLAGKFTSNRGLIINIPVVGNTPCANDLTIMSGPGGMVVPAFTTPAARTMTKGANVQTTMMTATLYDLGCVKVKDGETITTTGAGVGGAFTIPTAAFSKPLPTAARAVEVKYATPVLQLATSFAINGPPSAIPTAPTPSEDGNVGIYFTGANGANFRAFRTGAWTSQTGRGGSDFTWCFGNGGCTNISQATRPVIVKYNAGPNAFGGTMSYVINSGVPGASNLAIGLGGGVLGINVLAGMGSQPTGRGYAQLLSDMLAMGPIWGSYARMTVTAPEVGMQLLITAVGMYVGPLFGGGYNYNYGFPWTSGTVLARNTGTAGGNPAIATISAMGGDTVTSMGGRNISLVAGGIAITTPPLNSNTPEIGQMLLSLPEPGAATQLLAGVVGLLAIAGWRQRKNR